MTPGINGWKRPENQKQHSSYQTSTSSKHLPIFQFIIISCPPCNPRGWEGSRMWCSGLLADTPSPSVNEMETGFLTLHSATVIWGVRFPNVKIPPKLQRRCGLTLHVFEGSSSVDLNFLSLLLPQIGYCTVWNTESTVLWWLRYKSVQREPKAIPSLGETTWSIYLIMGGFPHQCLYTLPKTVFMAGKYR